MHAARALGIIAAMPHPQSMSMLRLLAALSWADGTIADGERAALEGLIGATDLDDDERATATGWIASPVEMDEAALSALSENQRLATYQMAVRMAHSDDEVPDSERDFLERVRAALGVSVEDAQEIESAMPRHD